MTSFKDKKVGILGTALEGISSAKFLKNQGAKVTLLDQKNQDQMSREIVAKAHELEVEVYWGEDYLRTLSNFEIIVRTPVVRPDLPEILAAKDKGAIVTSNTKIFFELCPAKIIGVTGTKGKGTTSTLIYEMLKKAGRSAFLGGNIGNPSLELLPQLSEKDFVVLELSSFQLFDLEQSPSLAVALMITSEHLDWHTDAEEYKKAKLNIVAHQNSGDSAVVNIDYSATKEFLSVGLGEKLPVSTKEILKKGVYLENEAIFRNFGQVEKVIDVSQVGLVGKHNLENISAAVAAASILEVPLDAITEVAKEFKGLEHRLEFVRSVNGVIYYNDSFSTTPETAIAAINSFTKPEIVILGGSDKGSDYTQLGQVITASKNLKALVLIGKMSTQIKEAVGKSGGFSGQILEGATNMQEIISQAKSVAAVGDIVLLSPACASFDMFENYKQRGKQFKEIVNSL